MNLDRKKKERVNITDLPYDLFVVVQAAIKAGQTDIASEIIGNYLKEGERKNEQEIYTEQRGSS